MERQKYFLILLLLLPVLGLKASDKAVIYKAYISNDMHSWKQHIDGMQKSNLLTNSRLLELVNYQYGYIGWCMSQEKKTEASVYLDLAEANLKQLELRKYPSSYINAYKSAFYGYRIGLNVLKAPFLGPKSVSSAQQAMKQDSTNPYSYIQYANAYYYMPSTFGGSKKLALVYYQKAERLMRDNPKLYAEDWNFLNLLATIGNAYEETGNLKAAKIYYEHILVQEPGFLWVKNTLYPRLLKKMQ